MGLLALTTCTTDNDDGCAALRSKRRHWRGYWLAAMIVSLPVSPARAGGADSARVDRVKAAFVLNIARFVTWPQEVFADQPGQLRLCYYRDNPLAPAIRTLKGKKVGGRRVVITRVPSLTASDACHILLIAPSEFDTYASEAVHSPARPLLTIADLTASDASAIGRRHVLVTLVRNNTRIGFEINLARVREVGLRMSSKLLKLAKIVGDGG